MALPARTRASDDERAGLRPGGNVEPFVIPDLTLGNQFLIIDYFYRDY